MGKGEAYRDVVCRYFPNPGGGNTRAVIETVASRARERGIGKVLVASCSGKTALMAVRILSPDIRTIAVTHVTGFLRPNFQELTEETRQQLIEKGVAVLTCQHAFGGVGRGIRKKLATYQVDEIMAYTLRTFGQGTKVAVEIAVMAADAGLVRTDEDVISVGGTASGVDTALIVQPACSADFFEFKVKEIVCKPNRF
ncbi:MAG: hypothetical protein JW950_03060 [Deltaproteobacteria bacterium]|nr:hypothetical protein [Deltaproteobacteria bacterium]